MAGAYIPDAGDLVWLHFTPQDGREQAGHRHALVLALRDITARPASCSDVR
jgi:mRNA interferase MazF